MMVAQKFLRNRKITITTSATVRTSVNWTSATEARMVAVRSAAIVTLTAGGTDACNLGSSALIRSTVSMTLAPGTRWTARMTAGCLPYQPASRSFSGASIAVPMSRIRTGEPLR
jgi:hypothetical protein